MAIGAKQFVVHDALDINFESSLRSSSFTPNTTVASISSFGGTVKTTFLAPASICFSRDFLSAKMPVDSITISMSSSFQGNSEGFATETNFISLSSIFNISSLRVTS